MKFSVGLQYGDESFLEEILKYRGKIDEVYFSWGDMASGRGRADTGKGLPPWETMELQLDALRRLSGAGVRLNLLFNAECYGEKSLARSLYEKIGDVTDYVRSRFGLASVTTTSPTIARFVRDNFPDLHVRASVNMEIGTVEAMEYLGDLFDGFYVKREYNRDLDRIRALHAWCERNGKLLYLLANSGCMNHCPARHYHDSLVAHEDGIRQMDNAYTFKGLCREYFGKPENREMVLTRLNFIRPEDIPKYEPYIAAVKLATRVSRAPAQILRSYAEGRYAGDLLALLEPAQSVYPYVLENGEPPRLVKLETDNV